MPETASCRFVSNDCHAFVEIQEKEGAPWAAYNLGGYAADLKINQENMPKPLAEKPIEKTSGFNITETILPKEKKLPALASSEEYDRAFETWQKTKPRFNTPDAFYQRLTGGLRKKQLIEFTSGEDVRAMSLALEQYCHRIHRPVFYIHSPDDLVCSASYVERNGERGVMKAGPGGALHDFLLANHDSFNPPVLIVNYSNFDADDIVRLNSLLDEKPMADGTPLPECAIVTGLINIKKSGCYQGSDFYSRFGSDNIQTCPFAADILFPEPEPIAQRTDDSPAFEMNFFHAQDWEERLLGRWIIKKDNLYFEKGLLAKAVKSGQPIVIRNGRWDDASFSHFWERARASGFVDVYGERFDISNVVLLQDEGYNWKQLKEVFHSDGRLKVDAISLNPTSYSEFFNRYACDNESHQLDTLDGIIAEHAGKTLDVNVTRTLSEDEWARLLAECTLHQVSLNCHLAPSVILPSVLGETPVAQLLSTATPVIQSTDVDVTVTQLSQKLKCKVIDVSELDSNDLLTHTAGKFDQQKLAFEFTRTDRILKQSLANNEQVILKGQFSPELVDALAPLLIQGEERIRLVMSDATSFNYINVTQHDVSVAEKFEILERNFPAGRIKSLDLEGESLCHLRARLVSPDDHPWQGLRGLSGGIRLHEFDEKNSEEKSRSFIQQRLDAVNARFEYSPFIYLTGHTGVGKSTFVEKYLASENTRVYIGESQIRAWALDQSKGRKILFLDEANLTARQWSEIEGLFNDPPGILIDGNWMPLSPEHKVIFAGNPLNYGGERKMASLFERHGNALVFEPLPPEFIHENILKPVFAGTELEDKSLAVSREILNVYRFLCECSSDEVLISPRELQMMALLVLSHAHKNPRDDLAKVTRHYARQIAFGLVPEEYQDAFQKQFPDPKLLRFIENRPLDFVLTPTREPLYHHLNDLMSLREYRRNQKNLNDTQLHGGLGGIVIEGEPGIGKSELVIAQLRTLNFEEVNLDTKEVPENAFYRMPISMQKEEKERLLLKAFDEGSVVIVDEINSAPMMERLMNDLLMNRTPEGRRPARPGFMVLGTQNPVTMAGRLQTGSALKRRITTTYLPLYPADELEDIVVERGVERSIAEMMVGSFQKKLEQAMREKLTPAPTVRDVMHAAKNRVRAVGKVSEKDIIKKTRKEKASVSPSVMTTTATTSMTATTATSTTAEISRASIFNSTSTAKSTTDKRLDVNDYVSMLDDLERNFQECRAIVNKPDSLQQFFGTKNTSEWQAMAKSLRRNAEIRLTDLLREINNDDEKIIVIKYAMTLDLFTDRRSNILTKETTAMKNLRGMLKEVSEHKEHANDGIFKDKFNIYRR